MLRACVQSCRPVEDADYSVWSQYWYLTRCLTVIYVNEPLDCLLNIQFFAISLQLQYCNRPYSNWNVMGAGFYAIRLWKLFSFEPEKGYILCCPWPLTSWSVVYVSKFSCSTTRVRTSCILLPTSVDPVAHSTAQESKLIQWLRRWRDCGPTAAVAFVRRLESHRSRVAVLSSLHNGPVNLSIVIVSVLQD